MKIALFGCNGYLGRHLANDLILRGYSVTGFGMEESPYIQMTNYQKVDIHSKSDIESIVYDFDQVFFFAGVTGTQISFEEYEKFINVNETGLINVLNSIKIQGYRPKVIFPSTRLVYKGVKGFELKEDSEKEFKTIYALTKYSGEKILAMYTSFGIDYTIYRICVPYGNSLSNEYSYGTCGLFVKEASEGRPILIYGDGQLERTFTHIVDICDQIITTSNMSESRNEIYNIAGETLTLLEAAREIANKFGVAVKLIDWPKRAYELESGDTVFDSSKIRQIYNNCLSYSYSDWVAKINSDI